MNVEEVGRRLDALKSLYESIIECPISEKVATKEEQETMRLRIEAVFDRYNDAIENGVTYIPKIRKELNSIEFTLQQWIEYDEIAYEKLLWRLAMLSGLI